MATRSHHGCARCKKRRQKCDEARPSCSRCIQSAVACEYSITLKWNGRVPRERTPPKRQRRKQSNSAELEEHNHSPQTPQPSTQSPTPPSIPTDLDPLPHLTPTDKFLLHHFTTETSLLSSHAHLRNQICEQIIPMALQSPALQYATMAFAALHRATLLHKNQQQLALPDKFLPEHTVARLLSASLVHLRNDLQTNTITTNTALSLPLLHTIRTLCHCEIYSGKADSSWRIHVNGALAVMHTPLEKPYRDLGPCYWLWERWYRSIQAQAAVTQLGFPQSQWISASMLCATASEPCMLDLYTGYSSDLNSVFAEIGAAVSRRRQQRQGRNGNSDIEPEGEDGDGEGTQLLLEAKRLERIVQDMIRRDSVSGPAMPAEVSITPSETRQFNACNTAYQYSALIHIYRRVWGLDSWSKEVQDCVRQILSAVCGILPITILSPWVLLTTPIYTAGREAVGQDRALARDLLLSLYETMGIRNMLRAVEMLEKYWAVADDPGGTCRDASIEAVDSLDFIPY